MPFSTYTAIFFCSCRSCFSRRQVTRGIFRFVIRFSVHASLWLALLGGNPRDAEFIKMLSYVLIVTVFDSLLPLDALRPQNGMWDQEAAALSPLHPFSFQPAFHAMLLGKSVGRFITVVLPGVVLSGFLYGVPLPVDFQRGVLSVLQITIGLFLSYQVLFLIIALSRIRQCVLFRHVWHFQTAMLIFGGAMVPIWLYPDFLKTVCAYLPFRFFVSEAAYACIGKNTAPQSFLALGATLLWAGMLWLSGQALWQGFSKRTLIDGR